MFLPVARNVYKWETPDPEHGEMMAGHMLVGSDGVLLIDPPMVPGLLKGVAPLGKVVGVIVTSASHKRGAATISAITGAPYYFPAHLKEDSGLEGAENVRFYDGSTELPMGLKAIRIRGEKPMIATHHIDETVLVHGDSAFVGDVAHGYPDGRIAFAPEDIIPNPSREGVASSFNAIDGALGNSVDTIFCGHGSDIVGKYRASMAERRKEFGS